MAEPVRVEVLRRPPTGWDDWLAAHGPEGGFMQTTIWAAVASEGRRAPSWWIEASRGDALVGGALLTMDRGAGPFPRAPGVPGTLLCLDGPVLPTPDTDVRRAVLGAIDAVRRSAGRPAVVLSPPPDPTTAPGDLGDELDGAWRARRHATALVDLERPPEELWRDVAKPVRRNVRRCREAGVTVEEIADRTAFVERFLGGFDRRIGAPRRWRRVRDEAMWDVGRTAYRFFVAEREGEVLATLGTTRWAGLVTEIASGRTPAGAAADLPVQDLLHWHVLEAHAAAADHTFDLAGFDPTSQQPKDAGIRQFKTKWGGRVVETTRYERPTEAPVARLLHRARRRVTR